MRTITTTTPHIAATCQPTFSLLFSQSSPLDIVVLGELSPTLGTEPENTAAFSGTYNLPISANTVRFGSSPDSYGIGPSYRSFQPQQEYHYPSHCFYQSHTLSEGGYHTRTTTCSISSENSSPLLSGPCRIMGRRRMVTVVWNLRYLCGGGRGGGALLHY